MSVSHGHGYRGMSEERLHDVQGRAFHCQVRRERVPQRVPTERT